MICSRKFRCAIQPYIALVEEDNGNPFRRSPVQPCGLRTGSLRQPFISSISVRILRKEEKGDRETRPIDCSEVGF